MKLTFLKTALVLLTVLFSSQSFAHALWIETNATGTKGKPQEISVFFGEYSDKDITPVAKWFSDIKIFSLVLISPSKKEIRLTPTALEDRYRASFTPDEDGVYTVVMNHIVKDVYRGMKLFYNSSANVVVGNKNMGNTPTANKNEISVFSENADAAKKDTKVTGIASYEGVVAKKQKIKVIAPNGWEKEVHTNDQGEFGFTPIWSGQYMLEFVHKEKSTGEHNGKSYEELWKMATYSIIVK